MPNPFRWMSRVTSWMSGLLVWMSGADLETLAKCPSERKKFVAMGGTVATTSGLATVSAAFTADTFLHTGLPIAIVAGAAWGLAIMTLDRFLIMSIRRQDSWLGTLLLAAPRIALAVIAGLVIAKPVVLQIFNAEITAQATVDRQDAYAAAVANLTREYSSIPKLQSEIVDLQQQLTSQDQGSVLLTDPEYRIASEQAAALQKRAAQAQAAALCELDGTCGTGHIGAGPVYAVKAQAAAALSQRVTAAQAQLNALGNRLLGQESTSTAQAHVYERSRLRAAQAQLPALQSEKAAARRRLRTAYRQPIGLLDRIEALNVLASRHSSMAEWNLLISALILLLDSAPALSKALMSIGKPSLYERVLERREAQLAAAAEADLARSKAELAGIQADLESDLRIAEAVRRAEEHAREIEAGLVVDEAKIRRESEREIIRGLIAKAVEVQRQAGEMFISSWGQATLASIPARVNAALRRMTTSPANGDRDATGGPHTNDRGTAGADAGRNHGGASRR